MSNLARTMVVLVALLWGFNFVVIRWGIEGVDPATMTALRFFLTAIPMVFFIKRPTTPLALVALYGVLFGGGIWGFVNLAIYFGTPAGFSSLLLQLSAFTTVIVAVTIFKEPLPAQKAVGIAVAFSGFLVVIAFRSDGIPLLGVGLVILAALSWTMCNVIVKVSKPADVVSFIVWSSLFVPIPIILISLGQQFATHNEISVVSVFTMPNMKGWASILFQAFATTLLGYGVWTWAIGRYGLANVAPYSLLVPISGLFFGWLLYNESLSPAEMAGSALVIIGLLLLSIQRRPKVKTQSFSAVNSEPVPDKQPAVGGRHV